MSGYLLLEDGTRLDGELCGALDRVTGEVGFNTAMTGYQEILTDPSYAGQLITFTFPHIGNVGANAEDLEALTCHARGLVLRAPITDPANYRAQAHLARWLEQQGLVGIAAIDTRRLTRRLRESGAQTAALGFHPDRSPDIDRLAARTGVVDAGLVRLYAGNSEADQHTLDVRGNAPRPVVVPPCSTRPHVVRALTDVSTPCQ